MHWLTVYLFLLDVSIRLFFKITCSASDFRLQGDYILGGLFSLNILQPKRQVYPVALECQRYDFDDASYQMLQMMRFAVEEINNSSSLLPNVSLGYEIFAHCSNTQNFPSVFSFISQNGSVPVNRRRDDYQPKIIALTGPYESTATITVAPFFMVDLIPMVNYGSSSYELSNKKLYPSFLRTVPSNKDLIWIIILIIKQFGWNWIAFIGSKDDYSQDGLNLFYQYSRQHNICLAYQELLSQNSDYYLTLQKIEKLNIKVIVVFSIQKVAESIIKSAIKKNIKNKVWIAGEGWSMSKHLQNEPGIENIGTILGITGKLMELPGFNEFVYRTHGKSDTESVGYEEQGTCNQVCEKCANVSSEEIISENPSFSFPVYAAIYTIAHALHNFLHCDANGCNKSIPVYPFMLLNEMKILDFSLNGQEVRYDQNGDPCVSYGVVLWHTEASPPFVEMIGEYNTYPEITFTINKSFSSWVSDTSVPFGKCSADCKEGYQREKDKNQACCFQCKICPSGTYINVTYPYICVPCNADEWSEEGSINCEKRSVMYLSFTAPLSILVMLSAASLVASCIAVTILFSFNYHTPVVKSAGGSMCFLILASLTMASLSVFFFFGQPTVLHCVSRNVMFYFFHSVCFSCMGVRSFQIVCVFKMASKFPKVHRWWVKFNGQWLAVIFTCIAQLICCILWVTIQTPAPFRDESSHKNEIILGCSSGALGPFYTMVFLIWFLSVLCFVFSYMGSDLPKNYNEAKSITYSMLLFYISWSFYFTTEIAYVSVYVQLFHAIAQLSSLFGILLSYFIPKCYVIIFQPKKNTQAYLQTCIQNYTQTISRM
ncbi:taste receptor type 1 member 2.2 [Brachyhypopomus gauderio]|uniref:taste receptor type 1 member 2.2 n=1 Tax=Brachyhypopomus gauderio TaxID=698409 RepID=UPI0040435019